ncbi:MAG TPA: alpha/beta fold hydrolase [Candidatus Polarisedimenticolia bacterium]|nr:alpha/beta fold hydrolase [Candidatus Polarisedimenticolia bacterium]
MDDATSARRPGWRRRLGKLILAVAALALSALGGIVLLFAIQARVRLPDLHAWHKVRLEEEFRAGARGAPATFQEYRELEDRLFAELRRKVLDDPKAADPFLLGRYHPGSVPERLALDTVHNHSYELTPATPPRGSVLLVHGLSDSPYSMRGIAQVFFDQGFDVVVLRLPGHGTIPGALRDVTWPDWYAAVALAARYAASRAGAGHPFFAAGHSTGAALLSLYAVRAAEDASLPRPERLFLVSPAIGISPFAVLTNIVSGLSFLPAFEKSQWIDVLPEYDPYKYNSFPVNAGNQIYALTHVLNKELHAAAGRGSLDRMPRFTVFQSLVDSTVTAAEVVHGLLLLLPSGENELVVFDVNRREEMEGLIAPGPITALQNLRAAPALPFRLTIVGNRADGSNAVCLFERDSGAGAPGGAGVEREEDLPLQWPRGVFSLGHVALPIPPDDPVYGVDPPADANPRFALGAFQARGESGALLVPLGAFSRLRSNPFFQVIRDRIISTLAAAPAGPAGNPR